MQTLTEQLIDTSFRNRVIVDTQLARLISGTPQRRHNLVNRAMNAGELLRLRRGTYVLAERYRDYAAHPFALAQSLVTGSYVSFETALAHHGWIPEAVYTTASVTPGRKSLKNEHPLFGSFSFHPLAINAGYFLELVVREQMNRQTMLIAEPVRALMDLVCHRKIEWQGMEWLLESMRVDDEHLRKITGADISTLKRVYKNKRVTLFLETLAMESGND